MCFNIFDKNTGGFACGHAFSPKSRQKCPLWWRQHESIGWAMSGAVNARPQVRAISMYLYNMPYFPKKKTNNGCLPRDRSSCCAPACSFSTDKCRSFVEAKVRGVRGGIDFTTHLITVTSLTNEIELFKPFVGKYQDQRPLQGRRGPGMLMYAGVTGAFPVSVILISQPACTKSHSV